MAAMNVAKCPQWTTPEELDLAEAWGDARLRALALFPRGEHQIVKCGSISVVWRQQTATGQEVFFKLLPPLFAQEPPLTEWLSRRWPSNIPAVLGADRHQRWLLTRAVEGVALSETDPVERWVAVIRTLARIQIDSIGRPAELLECGCPTRDLGALADELDLLLSETIPLCATRGAAIPDELVRAAHARRASVLADMAVLAASGVPATLVHGDFHAGNVIISADHASAVIIDWTDGARSHPFFDLLIFLRGRAAKRLAPQREALVHAYLAEWSKAGAGSAGALHEAFVVAQRLAPLYHAASYRRVFGIGTDAATEFSETLSWLLRLLVEASPV